MAIIYHKISKCNTQNIILKKTQNIIIFTAAILLCTNYVLKFNSIRHDIKNAIKSVTIVLRS